MKKIEIPYDKISPLIIVMLVLAMLSFSITSLIKFVHLNQTENWVLILVFDGVILALIAFIVFKYIIPAFKNRTALELNETGIVDRVKNAIIYWEDIKRITLANNKTSRLEILLKDDSVVIIPIGPVKGSNSLIYKTILNYFNAINNLGHGIL